MKEINYSAKIGGREKDMAEYILVLLRGKNPSTLAMTERFRQYCTWGARKFCYIVSKDDLCYGVQFVVSGLKFKGVVRVWYNRGSDYFDVEFLTRANSFIKEIEDLDFEQLHNVLHKNIEREDDPEV